MIINRTFCVKWLRNKPLMWAGTVLSVPFITLLWVISPFVKIKVAGLITQRIGHLALNTDLFFRKRQLQRQHDKTRYIFLAGAIANQQLFLMWRRHLETLGIVIQNRILRAMFDHARYLWAKTNYYKPLELSNNEYYEFNGAGPTLSFNFEEEKKGRQILKDMGIDPDKDWFVCVFARDNVYMEKCFSKKFLGKKDWSYHDYRNADIDTYRLAIDYIIKSGGYVIRMGQYVNKPVSYKHDRFIDYALKNRSDFMDIYLCAKCKFFMATSSGISDVAVVFDTPVLWVSEAPFLGGPFGKNCLWIPKLITDRTTGDYISFPSFIERTKHNESIGWSSYSMRENGYGYEDNSERDILDATIEMMERLDGRFSQTKDDQILLENYFKIFPANHLGSKIKTPIGREFLKKHEQLFCG